MATISDQLAADIHNAFNKYYTDLTNQDQIFFGVGDVQITKQDGTTATVRSWNKVIGSVDTAAQRGAANTFTGNQTITGNLNLTGTIETPGGITGNGGNFSYLKLTHATPYIDFHHGKSTDDYTHRIITEDGALAIMPGLRVRGGFGLYGTGTVYGPNYSNGMITRIENDPANVPVGNILASPRFIARFNNRGSDGNVDGGQGGMWFEEHVGYNHRLVLMCAGFTASVQYWQFLSDGNIWGSQRGAVAFQGSSDYRYKHDIEPFDGQYSLDLINQLGPVTFIYDDDEQNRVRRGIIAQQAQEVDPQYVKLISTSYRDEKGDIITKERLVLDSNVFLMDAICAIQVLDQKYAILSKRVAELEAAAAL